MADSQVLRWIDELNGVIDAESRAKQIKKDIKAMRKLEVSSANRKKIKQLYADLDAVQFKPDYMCLIIDKEKDYYRACKGFSINGVQYARLLGTNGGIKNSTIVFVSTSLVDELRRRIDNGRDLNKPLVTAKLEAYKALTCSASIPVSMPNGIIVIPDVTTHFVADTIYLNDECDGEPIMESRPNTLIDMDASDGYGMMLPSLAERWSNELRLGYVAGGMNTRFSFEKGMVFTFDFIDFADNVAKSYIIKDVWGVERDVRDAELILTESMVKLWDSYDSYESYVDNCLKNGYTFGITKAAPEVLENERTLNYQFIQSYNLSDNDIHELIQPTMQEISDVLGGDWEKTLLFLNGSYMSSGSISSMDDTYAKALAIDHRLINDPYVRSSVYHLICNRINEAKVGVIKVHGNYSIVSGDPFSLCQNMFGMTVTGILRSGEIYNNYWDASGSDYLACYRAPMTCHNNIRLVSVCRRDDARYWYRYMKSCTILNSWDTITAALNGMDFDGDIVMLTDNNVMVNKLVPSPAIMCIQRKAQKRVATEEDVVKSNIESFGNDIGKTTNWITSMFEVQSHFKQGSIEYKELEYRIRVGQLAQQNVIDRSKGIIAKAMPKEWHDRHSVREIEDQNKYKLYRSILADKKPYFMRYIYPSLMNQYNKYIKNTNKSCLREFHITIDELHEIPYGSLTDRQKEFLYYYDVKMPVGVGDCVMNRICRAFENEFDGYIKRYNVSADFDYRIMKSGAEYTQRQFSAVLKLFEEYNRRVQAYKVFTYYEQPDEDDMVPEISLIASEFTQKCLEVCNNGTVLCDILLDMCYQKSSTKSFVWNICGSEIIHNLLVKNNRRVEFPVMDEYGDIEYGGEKFSLVECILSEELSDDYIK